MNDLVWIDWLCLGLIGISILLGLMRGLLSEALGLAGWLVALVAARQFGAEAGGLFEEIILSPGIRTAVGFVLVVIGTVLLWGLMLRLLERLVQAVGMGGFNRLLGGVFGALRASVILVLITAVVGLTPLRDSADWQAAQFRPMLEQLRDWSLARYREWDSGGEWGPIKQPHQRVRSASQDSASKDSIDESADSHSLGQQAGRLFESARREGSALTESLGKQAVQQFPRQPLAQESQNETGVKASP
ncbi:CvpA family protein [Cobetia crustatorum]|uniref:CvpA family protein n=1 Tax=Cobetia crustatorum TaxID=553385 RepID=A0A558HWX5_9GAMM|nr:CvpA family protein [Cobetia crustatorum]TVU73640.1 CvpA family protein [Cobetia crustatorum]